MTVQDMINKARENAIIKTEEFYKEVCEGICDYKEEIKLDKETGEFQREVEHNTYLNIVACIRVINRTELMGKEDKERVITILCETAEYKKVQNEIAGTFIDHFKRYKDVYLA